MVLFQCCTLLFIVLSLIHYGALSMPTLLFIVLSLIYCGALLMPTLLFIMLSLIHNGALSLSNPTVNHAFFLILTVVLFQCLTLLFIMLTLIHFAALSLPNPSIYQALPDSLWCSFDVLPYCLLCYP